MLKPSKTFNLNKQTKRFMCTIVDPVKRNEFKRAMIQAQLASEIVVKSAPRDKNGPRAGANYQTNDTGTASTQV
jgi:hypothetical protein